MRKLATHELTEMAPKKTFRARRSAAFAPPSPILRNVASTIHISIHALGQRDLVGVTVVAGNGPPHRCTLVTPVLVWGPYSYGNDVQRFGNYTTDSHAYPVK